MKVLIFIWLLLLKPSTQPSVEGIVYDRDGVVASVTVTELGTEDKNKVYTNQQGEFEIRTITQEPILEFAFVGYARKKVKVRNERFIKVKLRHNFLKY